MRRWFLSYNSRDVDLVGALEAMLVRKDPEARVFFAPKNLRAGGYWLPQLAQEIADATAFILFVGDQGIGPWQVLEYYEALDRRVKNPDFPVVLLLLADQPAPGLPFLRQLHWIVTADPTSEQTMVKLFDATAGEASRPGELWRYTAPYRGLASMTETDSDFFFGRTRETVTVLKTLAEQTDRMALLVGNSGVGKSSLAQAGVLAALARQAWPDAVADAGAWPGAFEESRRWCVIKMAPGTDPIKALVDPFLRTWQFDPLDPEWEKRHKGWFDALMNGDASLSGLLNATERQHERLGQPKPPAFFLYIDQGEELYVRATEQQRRCFSRLVAEGVKDPRLHAVMSLRSDFFGLFQNDGPLYDVHRQVNVGPLREGELHEVVRRPSELLGARFEADNLPKDIARRTAAESAKDAGALPLLSYLLDDMWTQMIGRGDGVLRLPAQAIELGSVLADRANAFLARQPDAERQIRRIFTLKLATVREDGEPTRRRALRSEFTDDEWRSVSELADQPHRLLVVATPESGETYTEVAHESILRHWDRLHAWMVDEREFLIWKTRLEAERRQWQQAPESSRNDALLMGLALSQAQGWLVSRGQDLAPADREFIELSLNREQLERRHRERLQRRVLYATAAGLLIAIVFGALATSQWYQADRSRTTAEAARADAESQRALADKAAKAADDQRNRALLNDSRRLEELAAKAIGDRDPVRAALLALEGLPGLRGEEARPYLPALESTLYQAGAGISELPTLGKTTNVGPDRFAAVDQNGNVGIYDRDTGERLMAMTGHTGKVTDLSFSKGMLATGSEDKTARIWDAASGRVLAVLQLGAPAVRVVLQADGTLMTTCSDGTAKLWSVPDGKEIFGIGGHTGDVDYLVAHSDVHRALSYGADMTARLWDMTAGRALATVSLPAAAPAPEGKSVPPRIYGYFNKSGRLALIDRRTAGDVSDAVILDTATGAQIAHFDSDAVNFLGGGELVYVARSKHLKLWDSATKTMLVDEDTNWELETGYSLLWTETSNTAELLDAATGKRLRLSAQAPIKAVRTLPKAGRIFTAAADGTMDFWDSEDGHLVWHVADAGPVKFTTALDNDRRLLIELDDGTLSLWDTGDGTRLLNLPKQEYSAKVVGGNRIDAAVDGDPQIFDAETARALPKPNLRGEGANSFQLLHSSYAADGKRAATIVSTKKIRIWDVDTGKTIKDIQTPTEDLSTIMQFSADGSKLLTESSRIQAEPKQIWAIDSGLPLAVIPPTDGYLQFFNSHGNLLALTETVPGTPATYRTRLWRTDTTSPMTSLWLGGAGTVQRAQFVPGTDRLLVVRKSSQPFRFRTEAYDLNAGKQLPELIGPTKNFDSLAVSDDGRHMAAHSDDDTVRIWDLATGQVLATIPNIVGATASHDMLLVNGENHHEQMWSTAAAKKLYDLPDIPDGFGYWQFSTDARYFATWAKSGNTRLWDAASGRQLALLPEATGALFSPDGARAFARLDATHSAALVETATGRTVAEFPAWHFFRFTGDNKFAVVTQAQGTNTALVVDSATGQTRVSLDVDNQDASDIQPSEDGKAILFTFGDPKSPDGGTAKLFDGQSGEAIALPEAEQRADQYQLSPDGRHVVIVHGAMADLYDIESRSSVPLKAHNDKIADVHFDQTGRLVLTASKDGEIKLSDLSTGKTLDLADETGEPLRFATLIGRWVVAQSGNGALRTWDTATGKLVQSAGFDLSENPLPRVYATAGLFLVMVNEKFDTGSNVVRMIDESGKEVSEMALGNSAEAIGLNGSHDRMLAADARSNLSLWDLTQPKQVAQMQMKGLSGYGSFSFSPDGKRIAAAASEVGAWHLQVWDETGKNEIGSKDEKLASANRVSTGFSPDSKLLWVLITRFNDLPMELHLFDATTGKPMADPDLAWTADHNVLPSPKGDRILFYPSKPGDAVLWDIAGSRQIAAIAELGSGSHPTFSADESLIATAAADHTIKLWDGATGSLRATLSGHTGAVQALAISNDGRLLASGSSDGTARIWDIETGKTIHTLQPSAAASVETDRQTVQQVLFSDDGATLATRTNHLINLWNVSSGEQVAALPLQTSSTPLSFSPDGHLLLRGSDYGTPSPLLHRVFPQVQDAVAAARQAAPRCLTPAERQAAFLDPEPPPWCIELAKPPYDTEPWRSWLALKKSGQNAPLPNL